MSKIRGDYWRGYQAIAMRLKAEFLKNHPEWLCVICGEPIAKKPTPEMARIGLCRTCLIQTERERNKSEYNIFVERDS